MVPEFRNLLRRVQLNPTTKDALWYKDAIIYQVHVRTFNDSNGDGIGDFLGLEKKLDYLQELGVNAMWLMPFFPSPLRDDGYDIADYDSVHPSYGTLEDFRKVLDSAHQRGIRVIIEMVLNHTSDQHPWFQEARISQDNPRRDWYVWSDIDTRFKDTRIIFLDTEKSNWAWDPASKSFYWHRFFSHQPDLNYDNPAVREQMWTVMKFWLEMGVDGFRLDAVPYLIEREGTNCENLPETHAIIKELRRRLDEEFPGRMLLAEANQWPGGPSSVFRGLRRIPYGVSLPPDAANVHGAKARRPQAHYRNSAANSGDPAFLPVVPLSA